MSATRGPGRRGAELGESGRSGGAEGSSLGRGGSLGGWKRIRDCGSGLGMVGVSRTRGGCGVQEGIGGVCGNVGREADLGCGGGWRGLLVGMKALELMRGWGSVGLGWEWVNPGTCVGSVGVAVSEDEGVVAREGGGEAQGGDGGCQQHQGFAMGSGRRGMSVGLLRGMQIWGCTGGWKGSRAGMRGWRTMGLGWGWAIPGI